jgi:type I restriction enzyme S subunit
MNALKLFNLFYGLNKIETNLQKLNIDFKSTGLDECCKFSNIIKEFKNDTLQGYEILRKDVMKQIYKIEHFRDMLFYLFPINTTTTTLNELLIKINNLCNMEKKLNFQLSGKIYEYFIGRDQTAISELGAYFTDRHITNYIYKNILKPTLKDDGNVKTMIDPFAGSGGFTLGYIDYLNDNSGETIDWKTQLNNVHHIDANPDVVKYAKLEFYCMSGEFSSSSNVNVQNAFTYHFNNKKFDYIVTNPPYGGDKIEDTETTKIYKDMKKEIQNFFKQKFKLRSVSKATIYKLNLEDSKDKAKQKQYLKICKYLENKEKESKSRTVSLTHTNNKRFRDYADAHNIDKSKCKDKESVSFLMMMEMLAPGGTAIGVLKEGLFFDSKYQHLRKHLIENFKVDKIVSIDASQFENTTTKTSIIQFHNTGKTEQIEFYDLVVSKDEETEFMELEDGTYGLKGIKDRIIDVSDKLITTASYDDIVKEDYTFNHRKYNKVELVPGKGFKMVKLGDICKIQNGYAFKSNDFKNEGIKLCSIKHIPNFNFKDCKKIKENEKYNKFLINKNDILLALSGNTTGKYGLYTNDEKIYCNQRVGNVKFINKFNNFGLFIFEYNNIYSKILDNTNKSAQPNISTNTVENISISIPETDKQLQYWVNHISQPYNKLQECKTKLQTLEEKVKQDIQNILDNNETEEVILGDLCEFNKNTLKTKLNYINYIDISSIENNKIKEYKYLTSNYPSRAKRIVKYNDILYSSVRPNLKNYTLFNNKLNNNYICSTGFIVLSQKNINIRYIYYNLIKEENTNYIISKASGSNYPSINDKVLKQIKIQLPKDRTVLDTLNPVFEEIDQINAEITKQEELYNSHLEELRKAAIKS